MSRVRRSQSDSIPTSFLTCSGVRGDLDVHPLLDPAAWDGGVAGLSAIVVILVPTAHQ